MRFWDVLLVSVAAPSSTAPPERSGFNWDLLVAILGIVVGAIVAIGLFFLGRALGKRDERKKAQENARQYQQAVLDKIIKRRNDSALFMNPNDVNVRELHESARRWVDDLREAMQAFPERTAVYGDLKACSAAVTTYRIDVENELPPELLRSRTPAEGDARLKLLRLRGELGRATRSHFQAIADQTDVTLTENDLYLDWTPEKPAGIEHQSPESGST